MVRPARTSSSFSQVGGMGPRLLVSRIFRRGKSVSAGLLIIGAWFCLVTLINFESMTPKNMPSQTRDAQQLPSGDGWTGYLALLGSSPTQKLMDATSSAELEGRVVLRSAMKTSISGGQPIIKTSGERRAAGVVGEIVRGRRIQEMIFSQVVVRRGTMSRSYVRDFPEELVGDYRDDRDWLSPNRQREINAEALVKGEIRTDNHTTRKDLKDLRPNLISESDVRSRTFPVGGHVASHAPTSTSGSASLVSSRDESSWSESAGGAGPRKTKSRESEMAVVKAGSGRAAGDRYISQPFPASRDETHNGQRQIYDDSGHANQEPFSEEVRETVASRDEIGEVDTAPSSRSSGHVQPAVGDRHFLYFDHNHHLTYNIDGRSETSLDRVPYKSEFVSHSNDSLKNLIFPTNASESKFSNDTYSPDEDADKKLALATHVNTTLGNVYRDLPGRGDVLSPEFIQSLEEVEGNLTSETRLRWPSLSGSIELSGRNVIGAGSVNKHRSRPTLAAEFLQEGRSFKYDGFEEFSYNVTASDSLPLSREIPDTRPIGCSGIPAYSSTQLPTATVIICFHNEAGSVLLRTVHSVLDRSPAQLLDQIILVDDFSRQDQQWRRLVEQLGALDKVFVTRTPVRAGLVGARLLGSRLARSEVVVFLDAHCECNMGWLEPLLYSLRQDHHKVVSPYIDTIKSDNFQYRKSPDQLQGGFSWRLEFGWRAAPRGDNTDQTGAVLTPVISGGLFAVYRDYFFSIGGYDPEFNIWGGENFELSFKTWMCGGRMEILPCSRVGHVFRASLPYSFDGDRQEIVLTNLARVAAVWMDEYADIFYAAVNFPEDLAVGDILERVQLRKNLKCNSFKWYLETVFPHLAIIGTNVLSHGQVRNQGSLMCLDVTNSTAGYYLSQSACHNGPNQTFHVTSKGQLRHGDACIVPGMNKQLQLSTCQTGVSWVYKLGHLLLNSTSLCVTSVDNVLVQLLPCSDHSPAKIPQLYGSSFRPDISPGMNGVQPGISFQEWTFDYSFNWARRRRKNA